MDEFGPEVTLDSMLEFMKRTAKEPEAYKNKSIPQLLELIQERAKKYLVIRLINIESILQEYLDKHLNGIISAALGVESTGYRYEIKDNSMMGQYIKSYAHAKMESVVRNHLDNVNFEEVLLPEINKKKFDEYYREALQRKFRARVSEFTEAAADRKVSAMFTELEEAAQSINPTP